jgi:abortive infection bacteriophage resistance protein
MTAFSKPALTTDQQIDLLIRRGMQVADRDRARQCLDHVNYYRLRAYWLPFEAPAADGEHGFASGTNFDAVMAIYEFDRELRLLLLDAIERIEISLRTHWANALGLRYGAFAHEDSTYFARPSIWQQCQSELNKEFARSRETFADHYRTRYTQLNTPPIWVACELMTLGHLSRWLQNTKAPKDRQAIADAYGLDEKVLVSFAHHLTIVRNHCAHHGRVWNRKFSLKMQLPNKKPQLLANEFNRQEDRRLYNTLVMLIYLLRIISPASRWPHQFSRLLQRYPLICINDMGFPTDWQQSAIWQGIVT